MEAAAGRLPRRLPQPALHHFTIENLIAERDTVVARLTWSGTWRRCFLGVAATNEQVTVTGTGTWRIADGKMT